MRHALEPDHLAAVSTLMTGERSSAKAACLGACWGLGHTLTLLTTGALLVMFRAEMPTIAAQVFEFCVVMLLVGFGVRAIYQGACRMSAGPTHSHGRPGTSPPLTSTEGHSRGATAGGRGAWTGRQRRADGARSDHAAVNGDAAGLSHALWCRIDRGDGRALGATGLAARTARSAIACLRALSLAVGCVSTALGLFWGYPLIEGLF